MEDSTRTGSHDITMASRKAEETAWRRFQAVQWLESLIGPLGLLNQPSEREFISCLRNGIILCNAINKIHPGAVPKVVESQSTLQLLNRETQPLPAYQYFENVRNFLVAVEELKLPAFEASDLERDSLEAGSAAKVVDCILALKSYHESKQQSSVAVNGFHRHVKSPLVMHSANRMHSKASAAISADSCRRLDMATTCERQPPIEGDNKKNEEALVESIVKLFVESMDGTKENIDENFLASFHNGEDPIKLFSKIMSGYLGEQLQRKLPEFHSVLKDVLKERSISPLHSTTEPLGDLSTLQNTKCCKACSRKGTCHHREVFQIQEKELTDLKALLLRTKVEFEELQFQLQRDLKFLGTEVQELSTAARGYQKVVKENRTLYNMVQDLKGNIRVYCRIRPSFNAEATSVIDFIGEDGSLVLLDPSKPGKDGRRVFNFNRVFGPIASQDEIYKDTQPLIRSVMDGYNVCIFAYGQTGSGKTYTMSGPSGGSTTDVGINYLALNDLFKTSSRRKDIISYEIFVQMVEIYNEQVRDLLAEDSSTTKLEIRSCTTDNGLSLPDATMRSVKSTADVYNLIKHGEVNRFVSSTAMNTQSSRSHSVLTVHVHGKDTSGGTLRSCLHLVDLAGSERVDKSEVTGDRLKEAQCINKSLSCLGDVITALAQKNSHIPYRNSKLTLLLQDSLGGHAKTLMFAHVSPEEDSFSETVSTLKFAQRASAVELGAARSNKESSEVIQLKQQVENLKKALANKEAHSSVQLNRTCEKPRPMMEKTPPRLRRLSIENSVTSKNEMSTESRKGFRTPSIPNRLRRTSLEGPRSFKKDTPETNVPDDIFNPNALLTQKYGQPQDVEASMKSFGNLSNGSPMVEVSRPKDPRSPKAEVSRPKDPRSPTSVQKRLKTDSRTQIPSLQPPKTPEAQTRSKIEFQNLLQNELTFSLDYQTPNLITSTNGKGSQIRKSLRTTIGKLINGSEKRSQQILMETQLNTKVASNVNDGKSPATTNGKTLRRQSLTGVLNLGGNRRSSLGENTADNNNVKDNRNAKTPPPVRQSNKFGKRWV
ncbi:kinesin-like protein KIN-14L [Humulus lupulus]|uniref:kinesin-like protein KIN-14L n=1 Tax=Humulus lupulus TaxID=3486 RepID=UPI002B40F5CE|nr:kinesin-like protein KIN-14L [Humulus lupulus]